VPNARIEESAGVEHCGPPQPHRDQPMGARADQGMQTSRQSACDEIACLNCLSSRVSRWGHHRLVQGSAQDPAERDLGAKLAVAARRRRVDHKRPPRARPHARTNGEMPAGDGERGESGRRAKGGFGTAKGAVTRRWPADQRRCRRRRGRLPGRRRGARPAARSAPRISTHPAS
jgi:hypothetical protein